MFLTANQMADKIELLLNLKDAEFSYEDSELSAILNTAQEHLRKQYVSRLTNAKKQGLEETEDRGWAFAPLISPATLTVSSNQVGALENGVYWDLPTDYSIILTEIPTSNKVDCNNVSIKPRVKVISHDEYKELKWDYYQEPFINTQTGDGIVWRMYDSGNRLQSITNGTFTISNYFIKYLKEMPLIVVDRDVPANMVDCILHPDSHELLVELAIDIIKTSNNEQKVPNKIGLEQIN